jgi:hypothetical protein
MSSKVHAVTNAILDPEARKNFRNEIFVRDDSLPVVIKLVKLYIVRRLTRQMNVASIRGSILVKVEDILNRIKSREIPVKFRQIAVMIFIDSQSGKMLLKTVMPNIQPAISRRLKNKIIIIDTPTAILKGL